MLVGGGSSGVVQEQVEEEVLELLETDGSSGSQ
jgi:hypothetical protein